jgi:formylglycine-generating enzyme required for sulfatase activity
MKKLYTFILITAALCFSGKLNIDFNDATPSLEIDFSQIRNIDITQNNSSGLVLVKGGAFTMGDHLGDGYSNELPLHMVTLSDFYLGSTELTQSEWAQYMPAATYDYGAGLNYPVYYVSWYSTLVYCNKRSIAEGFAPCYTINGSTNPADWGSVPTSSNSTWNAVTCNFTSKGYRLPTEAEWEYAARGGIYNSDNLRYSGCNLESELPNYAWYFANGGSINHPVATKLPNKLGLYDMSGSVYEFCWDWESQYSSAVQTNPTGPSTGTARRIRSNHVISSAFHSRVADRSNYWYPHDSSSYVVGFRIARTK